MCEHLIQRGLEGGHCDDMFSTLDIARALRDGDMQLWAAGDPPTSCLVTRLLRYPSGKMTCDLFLVAGELDDCLRNEPVVAAWAQAQGCTMMEFGGRPGWVRPMAKLGYTEVWRRLTKEL